MERSFPWGEAGARCSLSENLMIEVHWMLELPMRRGALAEPVAVAAAAANNRPHLVCPSSHV